MSTAIHRDINDQTVTHFVVEASSLWSDLIALSLPLLPFDQDDERVSISSQWRYRVERSNGSAMTSYLTLHDAATKLKPHAPSKLTT